MKTVVVDTSAVLAILDESYPEHHALDRLVSSGRDDLVLSPFVVAEADYMLASRLGLAAARSFSGDIVSGAYRMVGWSPSDHALAVSVCDRRPSDYVGIADDANVVLAAQVDTTLIMTLDQRHFRSLKPLSAAPAFALLPYDQSQA